MIKDIDNIELHNLLCEELPRIMDDEYNYITQKIADVRIVSKYFGILINQGHSCNHSKLQGFLAEFDYYYAKNSIYFKEALRAKNISFDRHKVATLIFATLIEMELINIKRSSSQFDQYSEYLALLDIRIAFKFACVYSTHALYTSFVYKEQMLNEQLNKGEFLNEKERLEVNNKINQYGSAKEKLAQRGSIFIPVTRDELESYEKSYFKVIYLQLHNQNAKKIFPYALVSDTFYWIDVYTKLKLGIDVEAEESYYLLVD